MKSDDSYIAELEEQRDALLVELTNIANANTRDWDDPTDFKAWAQNRARHTIAKVARVAPLVEGKS